MADIEVTVGTALPSWPFTWRDGNQTLIDFSTGWTFTLKIGNPGSAAVYTQTDDITGAATNPNVMVDFDPTDLDNIPGGSYAGNIRAVRTSDSKKRDLWFTVFVKAAIT